MTKQLDVITLDRRQTNIMTIMLFDFVFFFYFFHHFSRERIFPSSSSSVERACQGHPAASSARPRHRSRGITHRQLPRSQPRAREPAHQPHGHGGSCPTAAARQRDAATVPVLRPGPAAASCNGHVRPTPRRPRQFAPRVLVLRRSPMTQRRRPSQPAPRRRSPRPCAPLDDGSAPALAPPPVRPQQAVP